MSDLAATTTATTASPKSSPKRTTRTPHGPDKQPSVWDRIVQRVRMDGGRQWGELLDSIKEKADAADKAVKEAERKAATAAADAVAAERERIAAELEVLGNETETEELLEIAEQLRRGEAIGGGPLAKGAKAQVAERHNGAKAQEAADAV